MPDAANEYAPRDDQRGERRPGEVSSNAKLSPDRRRALFIIERDGGAVTLEFERAEVVRLAQTLLAMAGVMVEE